MVNFNKILIFWDWFKANAPAVAVIITLSIFIFQQQQMTDLENKKQESLKESLLIEIDDNLNVVKAFNNVVGRIANTDESFGGRFSTVVLEEAIKDRKFGLEEITIQYSNGTVDKTKTKVFLRKIYSTMVFSNRLLDVYDGFFLIDEKQFEAFVKVKKRNYDTIKSQTIVPIDNNLKTLKLILKSETTTVMVD